MKDKRILLLAGGGGHTGYIYALAERLWTYTKDYDVNLVFAVPEGDWLSEERLQVFGHVFRLPKGRTKPTESGVRFVYRMAKAFLKSRKIVKDVDLIIAGGSNFCIPPSLMGYLKGIPLITIESPVRFTKPGKAVRLLRPFSELTVIWWNMQKEIHPDAEVYPLIPMPKRFGKIPKGHIFITAGSIGSYEFLHSVSALDLENVYMQIGRLDMPLTAVQEKGWNVFRFEAGLDKFIAGARAVITHLGFTAVEARLTYRKPTVIVYDKKTLFTEKDAELFAEHVGAVLVKEPEPKKIMEALDEAEDMPIPKVTDGAYLLAKRIVTEF
ncbi:hypothetical protein DRJ19_00585 [Candidatus Woesearchaeota archaeon]|nr:MAG: hypothetical protein DRJ19_00585 [Candidatus Woesearchaeota archaeon]